MDVWEHRRPHTWPGLHVLKKNLQAVMMACDKNFRILEAQAKKFATGQKPVCPEQKFQLAIYLAQREKRMVKRRTRRRKVEEEKRKQKKSGDGIKYHFQLVLLLQRGNSGQGRIINSQAKCLKNAQQTYTLAKKWEGTFDDNSSRNKSYT